MPGDRVNSLLSLREEGKLKVMFISLTVDDFSAPRGLLPESFLLGLVLEKKARDL